MWWITLVCVGIAASVALWACLVVAGRDDHD